jgi:Uma2 family endonuclease
MIATIAARRPCAGGAPRENRTMAVTKLWTVEDVERLPDDAFRYALIRGMLYRMPPTKPRHGRITNVIGRLVGDFVAAHDLGAVYDQSGFILARAPDALLAPDLAFVRTARIPADEDVYPELAPDLAIEVISPSQRGPSIDEKIMLYLEAGTRLVWAIDPARRFVRVCRPDGSDRLLTDADMLDGEDVLPGFQIPITRLFA